MLPTLDVSMAFMSARNLLFLTAIAFLPLLPKLAVGNVALNSTLSANDASSTPWLSPSGEFAFGFHQLDNTSDAFLLAIWFNKIPDKTIVWHADYDNDPALRGSQVKLTETGLVLTNPGGQVIWRAQPTDPNQTVSSGLMLDTGNFVLLSTRNSSSFLWESFNNPTDTLLPTQLLRQDDMLFSRRGETNFSKGRFELYFMDGQLAISTLAWPTDFRYNSYYNSTSSAVITPSSLELVFNESADLYLEGNGGAGGNGTTTIQLDWNGVALDPNSFYYRATLDYYGLFTQYAYPRAGSISNGDQAGWSILRYVPVNICAAIFYDKGSGACGYNSYCSMQNQRPTCQCADGYSLIDPNDPFSGCKPNLNIGCEVEAGLQSRPEEIYEFRIMRNVDWPLGDYESLQPYNQSGCQNSCLYDCFCAVAIFANQTCWKKRFPLGNGRVTNGGQIVLLKTRLEPVATNLDHAAETKDGRDTVLMGSLIGSAVVNGLLLLTVILVLNATKYKTRKPCPSSLSSSNSSKEINIHRFTYQELEEATNGFKEVLGRGSFGTVYKGVLSYGPQSLVAVKKLDRLPQEGEKEFKNELNAIGRTCHKNLVRLIGFCEEGLHRIIVYEFMGSGTLADLLFKQPRPSWSVRVRIALGIARALVYLQEECDIPIIHCDIKPQNVLLDENYKPKVSDFGLAKLLMSDQTGTITMIRGTRGYVAPEWFKNVPVTAKVDVYSFGTMLLEILCCRRSVVIEPGQEEKAILTEWAYNCYLEGRLDLLVDDDEEAMADSSRLHKWVMIAIWCIQEHAEVRPTMKIVMQMLEGFLEVPLPPPPSSFPSTI